MTRSIAGPATVPIAFPVYDLTLTLRDEPGTLATMGETLGDIDTPMIVRTEFHRDVLQAGR